jgi:hypothetical protein
MKLKTRTWLTLAAAATIALVCAWWNVYGGSDIVLPQQELQQKIDAKLPFVTKSAVTVSQAQLDLSGDKIGLTVAASATRLHRTYTVQAQTRGTLRYDNLSGAFYFHPEALRVIDVQAGEVSVPGKASAIFDKFVTSEKLRADKQALMTEAAEIAQNSMQRAAESALERVPVYTLPQNFKGHVARMALSSVEVKDGSLIAHMSFLQFTGMVLVYAGMFVLVLVIGGVLVVAAANGVALPFFF